MGKADGVGRRKECLVLQVSKTVDRGICDQPVRPMRHGTGKPPVLKPGEQMGEAFYWGGDEGEGERKIYLRKRA